MRRPSDLVAAGRIEDYDVYDRLPSFERGPQQRVAVAVGVVDHLQARCLQAEAVAVGEALPVFHVAREGALARIEVDGGDLPAAVHQRDGDVDGGEIGSASCRERVCQYV